MGEGSKIGYMLGVQLILQLCHERYLPQCNALCRQHKHQRSAAGRRGSPYLLVMPKGNVLKLANSAHMAQMINVIKMWAASKSQVSEETHRASGW